MKKVLVIDDETEVFMDYLFAQLEMRGYLARKATSLREAVEILKEEKDFCAAILDLMLPILPEDDEIFERHFGYKPKDDLDAMQAGLSLLPILRAEGIPVLILTNVNEATTVGQKIFNNIPQDVPVYIKPPKEDFYERLQEICIHRDND